MEKEYFLLEGKAIVNHDKVIHTEYGGLKKILFLMAVTYALFDRVYPVGFFERELDWGELIFKFIPFCIFFIVLVSFYYDYIFSGWLYKLKISNLTKIRIEVYEENPLNVEVCLKGRFNKIRFTFRNTEDDFKDFINHITRLNSGVKIIDKEKIL